MKAYKIINFSRGKIKTLFHGNNGSRVLPIGKWIEAELKQVKDGKGNYRYESGWHSFRSEEIAKKYLGRFKTRLDLLKIIKVEIEDVWVKPTNKEVLLSRWIKIPTDWIDFCKTLLPKQREHTPEERRAYLNFIESFSEEIEL